MSRQVTTEEEWVKFCEEGWAYATVFRKGKPWIVTSDIYGELHALSFRDEDDPGLGFIRNVSFYDFELPFEVLWTDAQGEQ